MNLRGLGPPGYPFLLTLVCACHTFIVQQYDAYLSSFFSSPHLQEGGVPLGIAAQKGHLQVVQKLIQGGGNVNYQNKVMTIYSSYMYIQSYYGAAYIFNCHIGY